MKQIIAENCVKFFLRELAELTKRLQCNSQREALMNSLPVMMMMAIGWKEFNTKA